VVYDKFPGADPEAELLEVQVVRVPALLVVILLDADDRGQVVIIHRQQRRWIPPVRGAVLLNVSDQWPAIPDRSAPAELSERISKRQLKERHSDGHKDQRERYRPDGPQRRTLQRLQAQQNP